MLILHFHLRVFMDTVDFGIYLPALGGSNKKLQFLSEAWTRGKWYSLYAHLGVPSEV
ncbi:MAG: hypothetical protein ABSE95_05340 [Thermodesulfobacteriota bacterium]